MVIKEIVCVTPGFFIMVSLIMCLFETKFILCILLSVLIHELGHFVGIRVLKGKIKRITFSFGGLTINYDGCNMTYLGEAAVAFMGPFFRILFAMFGALLWRKYRESLFLYLFCVNSAYFIFNMLPVSFLDGGKMLKYTVTHYFGVDAGEVWGNIMEALVLMILVIFGIIVLAKSKNNISYLFVSLYMIILCCKNKQNGVKFLYRNEI